MVHSFISGTNTLTYLQPLPEAFISKGKNRLKQNGTNVYLNNNDNFEIELFNPRNHSVLAKIKINGTYIPGGGLVLRPGQRHFLDRFLDVQRKLQYNTYEIDANDSVAVAAAAQNGLVEVEFYDEKNASAYIQVKRPDFLHYGDYHTFTASKSFGFDMSYNTFQSNSMGNADLNRKFRSNPENLSLRSKDSLTKSCLRSASMDSLSEPLSMETGRIEKGGKSDQSFTEVNMDFYYVACTISRWQIQPKSTEPVEPKDLATYCTECGKKLKDTFKFCPTCGTKLSA